MNKIKTIVRVGIADAHGIESYVNKTELTPAQISMFALRASLNRQRHAVAYEIKITELNDKKVAKLIAEKKYDEALKKIKKTITSVKLANKMGNVENSWKMIPNPSLDPYS